MTHALLASGGVDVSTGLAWHVMLKAAAGSTVLNPLTTLVQEIASQSLDANASTEDRAAATAAAQQTLIQALNLPSSVTDLGNLDLLQVGVAGTSGAVSRADALAMQARAVMVASLVRTGAAAIEGASSGSATTDSASKFVFQVFGADAQSGSGNRADDQLFRCGHRGHDAQFGGHIGPSQRWRGH